MSGVLACPCCGFEGAGAGGPTHAYMSPSAPCWKMYGEVLACEYSDPEYWQSHRLLTDAYCAHHSIADERRARQSINIHLAGLMLHYEDDVSSEGIIAVLKSVAGSREFPYLEQPDAARVVTIERIYCATNAADHAVEVDIYAREVFDIWSIHHATVRALIESVRS